jgi:hypothetical protein
VEIDLDHLKKLVEKSAFYCAKLTDSYKNGRMKHMSSKLNSNNDDEIRKEEHSNDEYAKNDETSPRPAKKYENCPSRN